MAELLNVLTADQRRRLHEHVARWAQIGLRTGSADRATFEAAARKCYRHAQLPWHGRVVWVGSPLVLKLAAVIAELICLPPPAKWPEVLPRAVIPGHAEPGHAVRLLSGSAPRSPGPTAVRPRRLPWRKERLCADFLDDALLVPVESALHDSLGGHLTRWLNIWLRARVMGAVDRPVGMQVFEGLQESLGAVTEAGYEAAVVAVQQALGRSPGDDVRAALEEGFVSDPPPLLFSGQLRAEHAAWTSFLREVCQIELPGDLWDRARSYEETVQSAALWYPHWDFILVCERPAEVHWEVSPPAAIWQRRLLHREEGPAVAWADGWSLHALHGRRLPGWVLEHPETIRVEDIEQQQNAEVRRIMIERYGWSRYIADCGAEVVDAVPMDHAITGLRGARLLRKELPGEPEPIVYLEMVNSTPEADGSHRLYLERIDPNAYDGDAGRLCQAAMASRWHHRDADGRLRRTFPHWRDYRPLSES